MKAIKCVFRPNDLLTAECIIAIYQSYKKKSTYHLGSTTDMTLVTL